MFRRFNNRQLGITLAVLTLLYLVSWAVDRPSDSSFEKNLAVIDTANVDRIVIHRPDQDNPVELSKVSDEWQVSEPGGETYRASESLLETALNTLMDLTATQLISKREETWSDYEVTDSAGVRVEVYVGDSREADIMFGRSQYQQSGMMTYVRPTDDNEVYLVSGFINSNFNKGVDEWRDKTLLKGPNSQWTAMTFEYPADSSFSMFRGVNNRWMLPDSVELDVTKVNRYLNRITNLKGREFVDAPGNAAQMSLEITTASGPLEIKAFPSSDSTYVLSSTLNQGAYFDGEDIWEDIFIGLDELLPE